MSSLWDPTSSARREQGALSPHVLQKDLIRKQAFLATQPTKFFLFFFPTTNLSNTIILDNKLDVP